MVSYCANVINMFLIFKIYYIHNYDTCYYKQQVQHSCTMMIKVVFFFMTFGRLDNFCNCLYCGKGLNRAYIVVLG